MGHSGPIVARLAAEQVDATGTVAGLDLNPGMSAVARAVTPHEMPFVDDGALIMEVRMLTAIARRT